MTRARPAAAASNGTRPRRRGLARAGHGTLRGLLGAAALLALPPLPACSPEEDAAPAAAGARSGLAVDFAPATATLTLTHAALPAVRLAGFGPRLRLPDRTLRCLDYPERRFEALDAAAPGGPGWRLSCRGGEPALPTLVLTLQEVGPRALELEATVAGPLAALEGIELLASDGGVQLGAGPGAFVSNGWQSWSSSGALRLPEQAPDQAELAERRLARANAETDRDGRYLSWWYGAVAAADGTALVGGALGATRLAPALLAWGPTSALTVSLQSGFTGEPQPIAAGELRHAERFWLSLGPDAWQELRRYATALGRDAPPPAAAPRGWNSWYGYWSRVDQQTVRDNARLAAEQLAPALGGGPFELVLDDGWARRWGDWEPNARFADGLPALTAELSAAGLRPGLWLAPLLVDLAAPLATAHPDWFVGDPQAPGSPLVFQQPLGGRYQILDVSQPEAAAHLVALLRRVVQEWGFVSVKLDFLFVGAWPGLRHEPLTGVQAWARTLELFRAGLGDETWLLTCGAPLLGPRTTGPAAHAPLPFDAVRTGPDIAYDFSGLSWSFVVQQLRNTGARGFLQGRALVVDPDPALLRAPWSDDEAWAMVVTTLVSGGQLFGSDPLPTLPAARLALLTDPALAAVRALGEPARPLGWLDPAGLPERLASGLEDFVWAANHGGEELVVAPSRWVWPSADGNSAVVAVLRLEPTAGTATVALPQLGLPAEGSWSVQALGPVAGASWRLDEGSLHVALRAHQALLLRLSRVD